MPSLWVFVYDVCFRFYCYVSKCVVCVCLLFGYRYCVSRLGSFVLIHMLVLCDGARTAYDCLHTEVYP